MTGDNGILNQANQAKIKSDIAEVKEQAQLDIANWTAEKLKNGEDTTLNDKTVYDIINGANGNKTNKYYSNLTTTSIITKQGNEILFSEFYKKEGTEGVDYSQLNVGDYISNYPVQYDNVGTWVDTSDGTIKGNIPQDIYKGWRILSIEGEGDYAYVKLVSAGVPLNYYHYDTSATSVENLTTKFFNTSIGSSITQYKFYKCGFKTASGTEIKDINSLKGLFTTNEFTATYASGESATYTDSTLGSTFTNSTLGNTFTNSTLGNTFTNADVVGNPKVQAMTKADLDKVWGSSTSIGTSVSTNDLLAIPCKGNESSKYAMTWLASANGSYYLWFVNSSGTVNSNTSGRYYGTLGVRPVVSLKSKVKFTPAENNINDTPTWNIAM